MLFLIKTCADPRDYSYVAFLQFKNTTYLITSIQYQNGSATATATLPLLFNYQLKYNKASKLFKFENEFGFLQATADQQ